MGFRLRGRIATAAMSMAALTTGFAICAGYAVAGDNGLPTPPLHPALSATGADADTVFETARFEFETGNYRVARRLLNGLLNRFPNTRHATEARRMLRTLSAASLMAAPKSGLGLPFSPAPGMRGTGAQPGLSGWQTRVTPAWRPQEDLAMTSGDRVFFEPGRADIGANAGRVIAAQARWLKAHPNYGLEISGHSDESGTDSANKALSVDRARAVRDRLVAEGIETRRIRIVGYGRSRRIAVCDFAACNAQNRRAVSTVMRWSQRTGLKRIAALP